MLAVAIGLASSRSFAQVLALTAAAVWAADLAALGLKVVVDRPRPFETIPADDPLGGTPGTPSLPSGHAATAFAGAVALSWLVPRWTPVFVALALAIVYSRVYLGVHYLTDVLAGGALGAAIAAALILGLRRPLRRAGSRPLRPEAPRTG